MQRADIVIENISELVSLSGDNSKPRTGGAMRELGIIPAGSVAISKGRIIALGRSSEVKDSVEMTSETTIIDGGGKTVIPGFVDPHTHLVFAGSRENELEMKLAGKSYLEILDSGGGILSTVRKTRAASRNSLLCEAKSRLDRMLAYGTTTVEAKSGYGLDMVTELKCLDVIGTLNSEHVMDVVPTYLGAHAIPPEFTDNPHDYVDMVVNEVIPRVSEHKSAQFCDVFCEKGVFSVEQSRRILEAGKANGLRPKIHADEIVQLGGTELAAFVGAISASHLVRASYEGILALAREGVVGVLVPGTPFALMEKDYPKARLMIDSGVPLALATDLNPNCWTESIQFIIALACYNMQMLPSEAITASTINAAHAIGRAHEVGSLEVGKKADVVILDCENHMHIPYRFGGNLVETVIKNGVIVVQSAV